MPDTGYACANPNCGRYIDPDFVQSVDWAPDNTHRILIRWTCECSGDRVRQALYTMVPRLLFITLRGNPVSFPYVNVNHLQAIQDNDPALVAMQERLKHADTVTDLEAAWETSVPPPEAGLT